MNRRSNWMHCLIPVRISLVPSPSTPDFSCMSDRNVFYQGSYRCWKAMHGLICFMPSWLILSSSKCKRFKINFSHRHTRLWHEIVCWLQGMQKLPQDLDLYTYKRMQPNIQDCKLCVVYGRRRRSIKLSRDYFNYDWVINLGRPCPDSTYASLGNRNLQR